MTKALPIQIPRRPGHLPEEPHPRCQGCLLHGKISQGQGSGTRQSRWIEEKPNILAHVSLFKFYGQRNLRGGGGAEELKEIKAGYLEIKPTSSFV